MNYAQSGITSPRFGSRFWLSFKKSGFVLFLLGYRIGAGYEKHNNKLPFYRKMEYLTDGYGCYISIFHVLITFCLTRDK